MKRFPKLPFTMHQDMIEVTSIGDRYATIYPSKRWIEDADGDIFYPGDIDFALLERALKTQKIKKNITNGKVSI